MSTSASAVKSLVVLAVDDHPLMRSALHEVIALTFEHAELIEAANPAEGLAVLGQRPDTDLILLDLNFAAYDGLAFIEAFRVAAPAAPLLVYTMHEDATTLKRAIAHGAVGIVPKTHSATLLKKAIEIVMEGGMYLPPTLGQQLASVDVDSRDRTAARLVSEQQWRILELLSQGFGNKEIGRKLGLAPNTVKNHLTVIFQRLAVSNRTQAAIAARSLVAGKERS